MNKNQSQPISLPVLPEAHQRAAPQGSGMFNSWKFWIVMASIVGFTALLAFGFTRNPKIIQSPLVGGPAPSFQVTEMNTGEPLSSEALRGTPYLLNFWASWCAACRDEAPYLKAAHEKYEKGRGGFRVIGIAVQDTLEKANAFARRFGKKYYLALDNPQGDISLNWGLYGVPETFFVDGRGIISHKHIGALTWDVTQREVEKLLNPIQEAQKILGGGAMQEPKTR